MPPIDAQPARITHAAVAAIRSATDRPLLMNPLDEVHRSDTSNRVIPLPEKPALTRADALAITRAFMPQSLRKA
jgi:hypothetical protein